MTPRVPKAPQPALANHPVLGMAVKAAPGVIAAVKFAAPHAQKVADKMAEGELKLPSVPVGKQATLSKRIEQAEKTAVARAARTDLTTDERQQATLWSQRAKALGERLALPVAKDKKKAHRAAIDKDLSGLNDEMNAALQGHSPAEA